MLRTSPLIVSSAVLYCTSSLAATNGFRTATSPLDLRKTSFQIPMSLSGGVGFQSTTNNDSDCPPACPDWQKDLCRNNSSPEKTSSLFHSLDRDTSCRSPAHLPPLPGCPSYASSSHRTWPRRSVRLLPSPRTMTGHANPCEDTSSQAGRRELPQPSSEAGVRRTTLPIQGLRICSNVA